MYTTSSEYDIKFKTIVIMLQLWNSLPSDLRIIIK